ncbi:unnamed protein product [marine sediment metagenome]|uniref:Uncharacterized protein n=1 Tax=marine sediment metagenome TaxID=412755 RepID=X1I6B2_9ZZZZ
MDQTQHYMLESLLALSRMVQAQVSLPHGDCPTVEPTFNICLTCKMYSYCNARRDFNYCVSKLEQKVGG